MYFLDHIIVGMYLCALHKHLMKRVSSIIVI